MGFSPHWITVRIAQTKRAPARNLILNNRRSSENRSFNSAELKSTGEGGLTRISHQPMVLQFACRSDRQQRFGAMKTG
jgi:hypothetical protein